MTAAPSVTAARQTGSARSAVPLRQLHRLGAEAGRAQATQVGVDPVEAAGRARCQLDQVLSHGGSVRHVARSVSSGEENLIPCR